MSQIILGRSKAALSKLRADIIKNETDITLIQEPYAYFRKVKCFGDKSRVIAADKKEGAPWAAIIVHSTNLDVIDIAHLTDTHTAVAGHPRQP